MCQGLVKAYTEGNYDALKQSCVPTTKLSEEIIYGGCGSLIRLRNLGRWNFSRHLEDREIIIVLIREDLGRPK